MQYQTPKTKEHIRNISNKIVESSVSIQSTISLYIRANIAIEEIKNGNATNKKAIENYTKVKTESREFMMKKIDNQILNYLKKVNQDNLYILQIERNKEYAEKNRNWQINTIINNRLHDLFSKINQDVKFEQKMQESYINRTYFLNQTKRARREEALRNRDVGMINWQEK